MYMYARTQPQGVRSFSSRQGDGNVMQMGFCGENFRRQRRERDGEETREKERKREREREREREKGRGKKKRNVAVKESKEEERRILGGVEAGRISLRRRLPPSWDRPRARIIFTEIKSKIRLALKCALDRARPNRRWLKRALPQLVAGSARIQRGREDARRKGRREMETETEGGSGRFRPKEFLAHANQRFAGAPGEERRDCTS